MKSRVSTILLITLLTITGSAIWTNGGKVASLFNARSAQAFTLGPASIAAKGSPAQSPQGTGFTYQGNLKDGADPANGQYDFQFALYDAPTGDNLVGGTLTQNDQAVIKGLFTVQLDFGQGAFNGAARYLDIAVRPTGGGMFTNLSPRQPITPAPYALFALKTQGYGNVITVAQSGGDYTVIQAALDSITDASPSNHYLVWVGPGTYMEQVHMKQYVDIEGSGEQATKIFAPGGADTSSSTLFGASNAELRFLTVESTGSSDNAIAILNSAASPSLSHVTVIAAGGATAQAGIYNIGGSAAQLSNVTVTIGAGPYTYGIANQNSSISMDDTTITVGNGSVNSSGVTITGGGTARIANSQITDSTVTVSISGSSSAKVATSKLAGGGVGGPVTCAGVYDENYAFFSNSCP